MKTIIEERIPIYVLDDEAKKFIVFQQYYKPFNILIKSNVFDQKNATILLDFDHEGELKSVRRHDILYSERFDK